MVMPQLNEHPALKHIINSPAIDQFDWNKPDYDPIFAERQAKLELINQSETLNAIFWQHYKDNPVDFIQDWMLTYDPRRKQPNIPFLLFERQKEFIHYLLKKIEDEEDGLCEKSRDMGITWLCCAFAVWFWIFRKGGKIGFGSRKEGLVDKLGDLDSIFEKMRFLLRFIPNCFQPLGYVESDHANYLKLINPHNGAIITGEAGDQIGRGGRNTLYFKDESAFYERPDRIEAALSQNTNTQIDVSTPNGVGNPFYVKRHGGNVEVFTFHWKDDPRKDQKWYEKQKRRLDPIIVAQEIDIDYAASVENICIPAVWIRASIDIQELISVDQESGDREMGVDVGGEGKDKTVAIPRFGPTVGTITDWSDGDSINAAYKVEDLHNEFNIKKTKYDSIGVGHGLLSIFKRMSIRTQPINVGQSPTETYWPDDKTSKEKFANFKAEIWWTVRDRFYKTYLTHLYLTTDGKEGKTYEYEDLIFVPNHGKLINELSTVKFFRQENGKIIIEKKEQLARRGIKSPDYADALMLAFAPETVPDINIRVF
jgi:hypothetical protein